MPGGGGYLDQAAKTIAAFQVMDGAVNPLVRERKARFGKG